MIQEAYVSFEIAKLLKEKGFDIPLKTNYISGNTYYLMPTHQMALAWLRKKNIYIIIKPFLEDSHFFGWIIYAENSKGEVFYEEHIQEMLSYEEATEAAIKYALENLI